MGIASCCLVTFSFVLLLVTFKRDMIFGKSKNSQGARSERYGGCRMSGMLCLCTTSCISHWAVEFNLTEPAGYEASVFRLRPFSVMEQDSVITGYLRRIPCSLCPLSTPAMTNSGTYIIYVYIHYIFCVFLSRYLYFLITAFTFKAQMSLISLKFLNADIIDGTNFSYQT